MQTDAGGPRAKGGVAGLDPDYLERWATQLGVGELLQQALAQA